MAKNSKENLHIFAIAAVSSDGFIAREKSQASTDWTSEEDKQWFWDRTKKARAVLMGNTTFWATRKPGFPLPDRKNYVLTRDPQAIWQRYENQHTVEEIKKLRHNPNLIYLNLDQEEMIARAIADGLTELAISGGSSVYTAWLPYIQTLYLTRETSVKLGGGLPLFYKENESAMSLEELNEMLNKDFDLVSRETVNDVGTIFEEWRKKRQ